MNHWAFATASGRENIPKRIDRRTGTSKSNYQWFMKHIAFCGSRMLCGGRNMLLAGCSWGDLRSGKPGNVELYGQRLGKQIG
jgi:hypothetical protein